MAARPPRLPLNSPAPPRRVLPPPFSNTHMPMRAQTLEIINVLLDRPPPEWQQHRNGGDWGGREFLPDPARGGGGGGAPRISAAQWRNRCHFWDGCTCWGERHLWPGKACRYEAAHHAGLSTLNKEKFKQQCERLGRPMLNLDQQQQQQGQQEQGQQQSRAGAAHAEAGSSSSFSEGAAAASVPPARPAPAPCIAG